MSAAELLDRLEGQGITVTVSGGSLDMAYTETEPSDALRAEVAAGKPDLLRLLTPTGLLAELRRRGQSPRLDERGKFKVPGGPSLSRPLKRALIEQRHQILALLLAEEGAAANPELAALVDRVGRCQQWIAEHAHEWSDDEWGRRREVLLESLNRMDAKLLESGQRLEQFGWHVDENGRWGRTTEPDEAPQPNAREALLRQAYREIGETLPSGALAWAEQHQPEMVDRLVALVREWEEAYQGGDCPALSTALASLLATCQEIAAEVRSPPAVAQPALIEWETRPVALRA